MRYAELCHVVDYLQSKHFSTLTKIIRCGDNVIELTFDRDYRIYMDLTKGDSAIYRRSDTPFCKSYQAAFDVQLQKRLQRTKLLNLSLVDDDKVLRLDLQSKGAYKHENIAIQFEFTGKHTNAIILDAQGVIIEALRHIDTMTSVRPVRPGEYLHPVPKANFTFKEAVIEDVEQYLKESYEQRFVKALNSLKAVRIAQLQKQLHKLERERAKVATAEACEAKAQQYSKEAELILANIYRIKPYATTIEIEDYEGNPVTIRLDKAYPTVNRMSDALYNRAKKERSRAKHLHIEQENLDNRISFIQQLMELVQEAQSREKIEELLPKQNRRQKQTKPRAYEVFWFDSYKVLLGRNAKANQQLLEDCKANDLWFHFKDRPSAHVVIVSDKQKIPQAIIEKAARLCVDFTVSVPGRYSIDYTKRRELQLQEGANVLYHTYDTMIVQKD